MSTGLLYGICRTVARLSPLAVEHGHVSGRVSVQCDCFDWLARRRRRRRRRRRYLTLVHEVPIDVT
jgi:hypothetical protein